MIGKEDNSRELKRSQIIYKGQCINSDDPMRLGRIRAILKTENQSDREIANENYGKKTYRDWDERDPFVFKPLLPFFINTPPKKDEYVHLFYNNISRKGDKDKFYIGGVYSSPTTSEYERYDSAVTNFDEGSRNKPFTNLLNDEGEYFYEDVKGVYSEPQDVTLYGRGTCDIVIKDDTVLLRAGKNKSYKRGQIPRKNEKRAFIQLSKFNQRTVYGDAQKKLIFSFQHQNVKKLVEYNITNPDNGSDLFTGNIYIYNITQKDGLSLSTEVVNVDTQVPETSKSLQTTVTFSNKTMLGTIKLINQTLEGLIKGNITSIVNQDVTDITISGPQRFDQGNTFPFYFRPQGNLFEKYGGVSPTTNMQEQYNLGVLFAGVSVVTLDLSPGYGLVYDKNKTDTVPFKPTKQNLIPKITKPFDKSVGVMGGDELYLLSHLSQKTDGGGRIDLSNTLYGIDENRFADEIEPKTSSLVRGEELLDLINLIIRYLVGHVHAYPGLPPIPQSIDGVKVDDLLKELLDAQDKILNKNIRIN
jgi:hypothetical protein